MRTHDFRYETDPQVVKKVRRKELRCSICPPNRGENASRKPRHGVRPPKSKNRKRGR